MAPTAVSRRNVLGGAALLPSLFFPGPAFAADSAAAIVALEKSRGLRIGLAAMDTGSGRTLMHRANERFLMCSTFKMMLAAATLARVDKGQEKLDRVIRYGTKDLLEYAPVARKKFNTGMTVEECCRAAVDLSDNTATNLLFAAMGGPAALSRFARSIGDHDTRFDRIEGALNLPDGDKDTARPAIMVTSMHKVLLGDVLSQASRARIIQWMRDCSTGLTRLRAGIPRSWQAGDKTGSANDILNDIAIFWPPNNRAPVLVAAYTGGNKKNDEIDAATLADIGKIVASAFI